MAKKTITPEAQVVEPATDIIAKLRTKSEYDYRTGAWDGGYHLFRYNGILFSRVWQDYGESPYASVKDIPDMVLETVSL